MIGCEAVLWPLASLSCPLTLKRLESYHLDSDFKSAQGVMGSDYDLTL